MTSLKLEEGEERMELEEHTVENNKVEEKRVEEKREEEKAQEGRMSPVDLRNLMGDVLNTLGRPLHCNQCCSPELDPAAFVYSLLFWIRIQQL